MAEGTEKKPMELKEWKARVQDGENPSDVLLHKEYTANFKSLEDQPEDSRLVEFVLNTGKADRYNDIIAGDGWELENYQKNPVVLWMHNQSFFAGPGPMPHAGLPIARGVDLEVIGDSLIGGADFFKQEGEDVSEAAKFIETTFQMVKGRFLNAVSVGFSPLEHTRDDERGGVNFIRQELLEFSVVPIPADSDALRRAMEKGIDISPIRDWAVKTLESGDELVVPRAKIEAVVKGLGLGRGAKFFDMEPSRIKSTVKARLNGEAAEELSDEAYIAELELKSSEQEERITLLEELNETLEMTVNTLEKTMEVENETKSLGSWIEEDDESDDDSVDKDALDGVPVEGIEKSLESDSLPPGVHDDDTVLVLRVVDESEAVESDGEEEVFRLDTEELQKAIEDRVAQGLDGMKAQFTKATGQVLS